MAKSMNAAIVNAREHEEYWHERLSSDFNEELCRCMNALGLSRVAFARLIGSSPAYVTKVLRGEENLTTRSMAKLARAVGRIVRVHLALPGSYTVWRDVIDGGATSVQASSAVQTVLPHRNGRAEFTADTTPQASAVVNVPATARG